MTAGPAPGRRPVVVVLDYGSGNVRSVVRMLERLGAAVELTADPARVLAADALYAVSYTHLDVYKRQCQ